MASAVVTLIASGVITLNLKKKKRGKKFSLFSPLFKYLMLSVSAISHHTVLLLIETVPK